ncbi:MAG: S1 RNA-binding domain-containing protein [Candidatus Actinomarina sp.]
MKINNNLENILPNLLGKKFKINDFAKSIDKSPEDLINILFSLKEDSYIDFLSFPDGTIRIARVGDLTANTDILDTDIFTFPTDIEISKLVVFGLSLKIDLRIEFDKCMAEESTVDKLKKMEEHQILSFLKSRAEFFKEENKKELAKIKVEKERLKRLERDKKKSTTTDLTEEEKKGINEVQKKHKVGKKAVKVKREIDSNQERKNRLEIERKRNYLAYGVSETNQEQFLRLQKKKQAEIEEKNQEFKLRIEGRKKNVGDYSVGQVLYGSVTTELDFGCFVNIGKSDGFINTSKLSNEEKEQFSQKLTKGSRVKCEIINIDLTKRNIDLIPTTKNLTKATQDKSKNTTPYKNKLKKSTKTDIKSIKNKKEIERIDAVVDSILESGGNDALKFFIRFISKNIKENSNEWSITVPKNKKNTIRLNNNSLEGAYINDKGLMVVMLNPDGKSSADLKYLIDRHVPVKDRQGKYIKVPKAVPLFLTFTQTQGKKKLLYSGYCEFFKEAISTGTNKWKNAHSEYAIKRLAKLSSVELTQPEYIK